MGGFFIPDPKKKLYFWSYSKVNAATGCPRKFLMYLYNVKSTDPVNTGTMTGQFLHRMLELYFGGMYTFSGAINRALKDAKIVDWIGNYHTAALPIKELVNLADYSVVNARKFKEDMEKRYGHITWYSEEDLRIKKDFTEVADAYKRTMIRSAKTWFTGSIDVLGICKDSDDIIIADYKFYEEAKADTHQDQLNCYNTLVPAVLEDRGTKVKFIHNYIIFLKQGNYYSFPKYDHVENRTTMRNWLIDFVGKGLEAAKLADIDKPERNDDNCKYCGYKRKCPAYIQYIKETKSHA